MLPKNLKNKYFLFEVFRRQAFFKSLYTRAVVDRRYVNNVVDTHHISTCQFKSRRKKINTWKK